MHLPPVQMDTFPGGYAYARIGSGPRHLVVFPGINDTFQQTAERRKFLAWFCGGFAENRTIYVISRPAGLTPGYTLRDLAAGLARVFDGRFDRVDLMGVSMGGAIAQEFAADYPHHVDRLILALAGPGMVPGKRVLYERWIALARARRWRDLYLDLVERTYGPSRRAAFDGLLPAGDHDFAERPAESGDFIAAVEACMAHDARPRLGRIRAPTLVLGGTDDQIVPVEAFRELADLIPNAQLTLFEGAGHGVFEQEKEAFDRAIVAFLAR